MKNRSETAGHIRVTYSTLEIANTGKCILCAVLQRIFIDQAQVAGVPVGEVIGKLLHHRRHDITPCGLWLLRPGGVVICAGEDSAKDTVVGAANIGGEGKRHDHIKLYLLLLSILENFPFVLLDNLCSGSTVWDKSKRSRKAGS